MWEWALNLTPPPLNQHMSLFVAPEICPQPNLHLGLVTFYSTFKTQVNCSLSRENKQKKKHASLSSLKERYPSSFVIRNVLNMPLIHITVPSNSSPCVWHLAQGLAGCRYALPKIN